MGSESISKQDDNNKLSAKFQYYIIILCAVVYAFAQIARYSYSSNVTNIMDKYSVSHADAGLPTTLYFFAYAVGQIVNGIFCKKYNPRIVLSISMLISVCCNVLLTIKIPFALINYLWVINGFAQSTMWPVLVLVIGNNIDEKRKSFGAFIMSMSVTGGTFLVYALSSVVSMFANFEYAFMIAGVLLFIGAIVWFFSTKNIKNTKQVQTTQNEENRKGKLSSYVLVLLIVFAEFSAVSYAIGGGLRSWVPSILKDIYNLQDWLSIFVTVFLPLFSLPNALVSGWLFKKTGDFALNILIMFAISAILILGLICFINTSWIVSIVFFCFISFSTGVITNHLTIQAPLFLKGKLSAGFLAGFFNGFCYVGSALATYAFGYVADVLSWNGVFWLTFALAIISVFIALLYLIFRKKQF